MNTVKIAQTLLRKAAGQRLKAQRKKLGYTSAHKAWKKMKHCGVNISYYRYQRLEKGYVPKNEFEMYGVSQFLDIELSCWLEGYCANIPIHGCERMSELTPEMQQAVQATFNDFVDRISRL